MPFVVSGPSSVARKSSPLPATKVNTVMFINIIYFLYSNNIKNTIYYYLIVVTKQQIYILPAYIEKKMVRVRVHNPLRRRTLDDLRKLGSQEYSETPLGDLTRIATGAGDTFVNAGHAVKEIGEGLGDVAKAAYTASLGTTIGVGKIGYSLVSLGRKTLEKTHAHRLFEGTALFVGANALTSLGLHEAAQAMPATVVELAEQYPSAATAAETLAVVGTYAAVNIPIPKIPSPAVALRSVKQAMKPVKKGWLRSVESLALGGALAWGAYATNTHTEAANLARDVWQADGAKAKVVEVLDRGETIHNYLTGDIANKGVEETIKAFGYTVETPKAEKEAKKIIKNISTLDDRLTITGGEIEQRAASLRQEYGFDISAADLGTLMEGVYFEAAKDELYDMDSRGEHLAREEGMRTVAQTIVNRYRFDNWHEAEFFPQLSTREKTNTAQRHFTLKEGGEYDRTLMGIFLNVHKNGRVVWDFSAIPANPDYFNKNDDPEFDHTDAKGQYRIGRGEMNEEYAQEALEAVVWALTTNNPSHNGLFYHNPNKSAKGQKKKDWTKRYGEPIQEVGSHLVYGLPGFQGKNGQPPAWQSPHYNSPVN